MRASEHDNSEPHSERELRHDDLFEKCCYRCFGEGGWHDCFDDTCCCADPYEVNVICDECGGSGWW